MSAVGDGNSGSNTVIIQQTVKVDARNSSGVNLGHVRQAAQAGAKKGAEDGYSLVLNDIQRGGPISQRLNR